MPIVKMPDGTQVRFPDDMPREQIRDMISRKFPEVTGGQGQQMRVPSDANAAPPPVTEPAQEGDPRYTGGIYGDGTSPLAKVGRFIGQSADAVGAGALFGFDDEVNAAIQTLPNPQNFEERRQQLDEQKQRRRDEDPVASLVGEVGGGLATGGTLAKAGLTTAGRQVPRALGGRTGGAALEGAAYGGVVGAGEAAPGSRGEGAALGATVGAATGGALEVAGRGLARLASTKSQVPAPVAREIADAASDLYRKSEQAGVAVRQPVFDRVLMNMQYAAGKPNPTLRPNTAGVLAEMEALKGKAITLEDLDELRQVVSLSMARAQPQDVRTLTLMKRSLDNFADNVSPRDITGDIRGFEYLKEARQLWSRKMKAETVEEMVEKAKNQATGFENGLVIQFRQLANNKNRLNSFSPEEQKMIKDVARRASGHGVLRAIGMLSPNSTFGGIVGLGTAGVSGLGTGAALAGAGAAAKSLAGSMTRGKVDDFQRAVATGVLPPDRSRGIAGPVIGGGVTATEAIRRQ